MNFAPRLVHLILEGKKTQARVPVQPARRARRRNGTTYTVTPFRPEPGDRLSVRSTSAPAGEEPAGYVVITDAVIQPAGTLRLADARAEGYRNTHDWKADWVRQHDRAWVAAQEARAAPDVLSVPALVDRFRDRWADRDVWVLTFAIDRGDRPRLLTPASRSARDGDEHGYTTSVRQAMGAGTDPGEAVDEATQARLVEEANDREGERRNDTFLAARRNIERELERLEDRHADAKVAREIRHMRARLRAIDRLIKQAA